MAGGGGGCWFQGWKVQVVSVGPSADAFGRFADYLEAGVELRRERRQ
jgi:hypothetical protein